MSKHASCVRLRAPRLFKPGEIVRLLLARTNSVRLFFDSWSEPVVAQRGEQGYHRTCPGQIDADFDCWRAVPFDNIVG
jgi:hypothetical protein